MKLYRPWLSINQMEVLKASGKITEIYYDTIEYEGVLIPKYCIDGHGYILETHSETPGNNYIIENINDYKQIEDLIIDSTI